MRRRRVVAPRLQILGPALVLIVGLIAIPVSTSTNTVGVTKAGEVTTVQGPNNIKPADCNAFNVTTLVQGSGTVTGSNAAELLLGSNVVDSITGSGGRDCLVGGDGADTLNGGAQSDVCIGGPGVDIFVACETQIQ